jgi:hypothetical protein
MFWKCAVDEHNRVCDKCLQNKQTQGIDNSKWNDGTDVNGVKDCALGMNIDDYSINANKTSTISLLDDDDDETNVSDNFLTIINTKNNVQIFQLEINENINLQNVMQFDTNAFKKIATLFKIRQQMIEKMSQSSTHNNDPWDFIEAPMRHFSGFTKIAVYYFYLRC